MIKRLLETPISSAPKSILLLGPRQTGKTTLVQSLNPDLHINLADEIEFLNHATDIGLLKSLIEEKKPRLIFIDEIQRIPSMLNTIQALLDKAKFDKKNLKFILTGSSARRLKRGKANLLPGRVFAYQLLGLCLQEIGNNLSWQRALKYGFLPEPYTADDKTAEKLLTTYAATFLKEEIQSEALTRNLLGFSRFLNEISIAASQIIDFSKLAKKSKISRTTCIRFAEILEDTLLAERIFTFKETKNADVIKHPKIYFFDIGVLNGLLHNFSASGDRLGLLNEHAIYNQLKNTAAAYDKNIEIFYFRTRHGLEIDFIIRVSGKVFALEVKSGIVSESEIAPLLAFKEYYSSVEKLIIVSPKETLRKISNVIICNPSELFQMIDW